MANITNATLWDTIRSGFPNFRSQTSAATAELFTEQGFEALVVTDSSVLNDFFSLSIRTYLQLVNISHAQDPLLAQGFGEVYDDPRGGYIQRMAVNTVKPTSPLYKGLTNGNSVDQFKVRKPNVSERFFKQNFDYQSLITLTDDFNMKQIFISEYGMAEFLGGILQGLENGYIIQKYENKLECLNTMLNSSTWALKDTQKYNVTFADPTAPTTDELKAFILAIKNTVTAMTIGAATDSFNTYGFQSVQDKSRLKFLVRAGFTNDISIKVALNSFNASELDIPIDVIEVENFGGLEPYAESTFETLLYEVYDSFGSVIGYTNIEGGTTVKYDVNEVFWKDNNASVIGMIADKGLMFEGIQNGYRVEPTRNAAGLYTNYWASAPNNTIACDPVYNVVVFYAYTPEPEPTPDTP